MALQQGTTYIELRAKFDALERDLRTVEQKAGQTGGAAGTQMTRSFGEKTKALGANLTKTLTVAAVAMGAVWTKLAGEFADGEDAIRHQTGLTGQALDQMVDSMKRVGPQVTQPLSEVGKVMGDLARRTGLTGLPVEALTKQVMDLARVTGEDAVGSVAGLTRMFGDWSIKTDQMAPTMDKVFRLTQETGVGFTQLSELLVQFGSPLRNLGLDFDTAAVMFAKFEQEGVNIQTLMPGLRMALKNFAAAGREPSEALQETFLAMQNAKSESELMTIAFDTFGARAGPDMAAAVREGRFEFDELINAMNTGKETIAGASDATEGMAEKWDMFKNKIAGIIGPFEELGQVVFGGVAALGPFIFGLGALSTALKGSAVASRIASIAMMSLPFIAIGVAVAALAFLIIKNWDTIKEWTVKVFGAVKDFLIGAWTAIKNRIADIVGGVLGWLVRAFTAYLKFWFTIAEGILEGAAKAFGWIPGIGDKIKGFRDDFKDMADRVLGNLEDVSDGFFAMGEKAKGATGKAKEGIRGVNRALRIATRLARSVLTLFQDMGNTDVSPSGTSAFGAPLLGMAFGTPTGMAQAAMAAVPGFQTITSGYRPGDTDSFHSTPPPWNAVDIGGTNLPATFNYLAAKFGKRVRELIYGHTLIEHGQRFHYAPSDHFDHVHLADLGAIVQGPALIRQGNIREAHIPLSGRGAEPIPVVLQGPVRLEFDRRGFAYLVSDSLDRAVGARI